MRRRSRSLARRAGATAPWAIAASAAALALIRLALVAADAGGPGEIAGVTSPQSSAAIAALEALTLAVYAATGALVATRRPRNPIGWLLLAMAFWFGVLMLSEQLAWHGLLADGQLAPGTSRWYWVAGWAWIPAIVPIFTLVPQLFPTGAPLSPRWRGLLLAAVAAIGALVAGTALAPGSLDNQPAVDNPYGLGRAAALTVDVSFAMVAVIALASAASLAVRFRRSHGIERQQIQWVWAAAALLVVCFVASALVDPIAGEAVAWPVYLMGLLGIPVAVAVAILRYRLYDIGTVVNRALVYGSLTATLALAYLACVLLLQLVLNPLTEQSDVAVAGSTLAVAACFVPARRRIQAVVDRRFYRRKYDAARTLEGFSGRLRDELDVDSLSSELREVLQDTLQPAHVSVWLRTSGERSA
jgi:hypothetical protein